MPWLPVVYSYVTMPLRMAVAVLAWVSTAALPAHVPVRICFCAHENGAAHEERCHHDGDDDLDGDHDDGPVAGTSGCEGGASERRCVNVESSQDLATRTAPSDAGDRQVAAEPRIAVSIPSIPAAAARELPSGVPRAPGPPLFLRLLALLI